MPRWRRWLTAVVSVVSFAVLVAVPVASLLPSTLVARSYNARLQVDQEAPFALVPGRAQPVDELVSLGELGAVADRYPSEGDFYFVTVRESRQSMLSWVLSGGEEVVDFLTREDKYGFRTPTQQRTLSLASMRTSEQVAEYVALQEVGYEPKLVPGEVLIEQMVCLEANPEGTACTRWSPSDEVLDPGDKILSVGGVDVANVDELITVLEGYSASDEVTMTIDRPGTGVIEVAVPLTSAPDDPDRTIVGFYPFDTAQIELPFELDIDTGAIGGPSAGLAFTLTLIDELTPGELTGGQRVAVTGTIRLDGSVGPIGGLRQKAASVAQAGVEVFLVPTAQGEEGIEAARRVVGDQVEIIPVADLDEALAALEARGGTPLDPDDLS